MLVRSIALAVILRSFIAPGFMLGVSADGGLSILFCKGPVRAQAQHDGHSHHHGDDQNAGTSGHVTPACTYWLTSGSFVAAALAAPVQTAVVPDNEIPSSLSTVVQPYLNTTRVTRGPPALV